MTIFSAMPLITFYKIILLNLDLSSFSRFFFPALPDGFSHTLPVQSSSGSNYSAGSESESVPNKSDFFIYFSSFLLITINPSDFSDFIMRFK